MLFRRLQPSRPWPLSAHLAAFALALALPVLAVAGVAIWRLNAAMHAAVEERVLASARALSADIDRQFTALMTTLEVLAGSPSLRAGELDAFEQSVRRIAERQDWYIVLADPEGRQLVNTLLDRGAALPHLANNEANRTAIETRRPYVSDLFVGAVAKRPIITISMPVIDLNEVPFVLVMAIPPEYLLPHFESIGMEKGWIGSVLDRNGRIIARSEAHERFIGQPATENGGTAMQANPEGVQRNLALEGSLSIRAWRRSQQTGLTSAVIVSVDLLEEQFHRAWIGFALGALALLALAGLLAYLFGREIAKPIYALTKVADAAGASGFEWTRLKEANEVGRALTQAIGRRQMSETRFRVLADRARDIVMLIREDGTIVEANAAATAAYGYAQSELVGMNIAMLRDASRRHEVAAQFRQAMAGGVMFETLHQRKDGSTFPVEVSAASATVGTETLIFSIVRDISVRREHEEKLRRDADHIRFLMRELSHRTKNLLAVIQAMARQTGRTSKDIEEFERRFEARIAGLARSHDLLVKQNWQGVPLADLVRTQVSPFVERFAERVIARGPGLMLRPEAANSIGMALHELATNASKYGALSVQSGKIALDWSVEGDPSGERTFRIVWREVDGPQVQAPERKGFGHQVVGRLAAEALNGRVALDFKPSGFEWRLEAPLATVGDSYAATSLQPQPSDAGERVHP